MCRKLGASTSTLCASSFSCTTRTALRPVRVAQAPQAGLVLPESQFPPTQWVVSDTDDAEDEDTDYAEDGKGEAPEDGGEDEAEDEAHHEGNKEPYAFFDTE